MTDVTNAEVPSEIVALLEPGREKDLAKRAKQMHAATLKLWPKAMMRPLKRIERDPDNPRENEDTVPEVMLSLLAFGAQQCMVLDKEGMLIIGDTRYQAAERLGWPSFPTNVATNLTLAQARALGLMDNKSAEKSDWHYGRLKLRFEQLTALGFDLRTTGFERYEIDPILASTWEAPTPGSLPTPGDGNGSGSSEGNERRIEFDLEQWAVVQRASAKYRAQPGVSPETATAEVLTRICSRYAERDD